MEGFDRRGQIRDPKTGQIKVWQPYTEYIRKEGTFLERPVGSGNLFWEDGTPAGRMLADRNIDLNAQHKAMITPQSEYDKLKGELEARESRIAALEAQLIEDEAKAKVVASDAQLIKNEAKATKEQKNG